MPAWARPQSAPAKRMEPSLGPFQMQLEYAAPQPAMGVSILFQQQEFLEKANSAGPVSFATQMQSWVASYQKTRIRARMACRPLFGEGSKTTLSFPKSYAPVGPPLVVPPERDLDAEIRQLEMELAGPDEIAEDKGDDDEESVRCSENSLPMEEQRSLFLPLDAGEPRLNIAGVMSRAMRTGFETPRGGTPRAMTWASTFSHQLSMRELSVGGRSTEGASSVSGFGELAEAAALGPGVCMMPKVELLQKVFNRSADDAEVHKDLLAQILVLLGIRHVNNDWVQDICSELTKYTTLNWDEYSQFVKLYVERQGREYEKAFYEFDKDGSGTIEANELQALLTSIGITPMDQVIAELAEEFDADNSGDLDLEEFCKVLAAINEREGFSHSEFERLKHIFHLFDDGSANLDTDELLGILGYLGYEMSLEAIERVLSHVDVDGSGTLSFSEFLFFMRKVREDEVERLEDELETLDQSNKEEVLASLLRAFGYLPDREAVKDAAVDSHISLKPPLTRRGSQPMIRQHSNGPKFFHTTTTHKKTVSLSDAYRFLQVYRLREGFTRAEAAELQAYFQRFAAAHSHHSQGHHSQGHHSHDHHVHDLRISSFDAGRAVHWLGYRASHEEHELLFTEVDVSKAGTISLAEFLKLVRKYRQKELDEIRANYLKLGLLAGDTGMEARRMTTQSKDFLGMSRKSTKSFCSDKADGQFGMLRKAVAKRNHMRAAANHNQGFLPEEVELLRARFLEYDADGSGSVHAAELRLLCQDLLPEMASDPKSRPELVRLLREVDISGEGRLDFIEFLTLMRDLEDSRRRSKILKEKSAREHLPFTNQQVRDFRELFVDRDVDGKDLISFREVALLLGSLVALVDRRVQQLVDMWQKLVEKECPPDLEDWTIDFPDFLKLMNAVLEEDFSGIKAKTASIVKELEEAKKAAKPGLRSISTKVTIQESVSTISDHALDALLGPVDAESGKSVCSGLSSASSTAS